MQALGMGKGLTAPHPWDLKHFMKAILILLIGIIFTALPCSADPLNNFIAPAIGGGLFNEVKDSSLSNETSVAGIRYRLSADFVSLHNHVSAYTFYDFGTYSDFGGQIRVFAHTISEERGGNGLIVGVGMGGAYSPGIEAKVAFADISAVLFFRILLDTNKEWGFFAEGSYEAAFLRSFKDFDAPDNGVDHRFFLSMGIPISTTW